MHLLLCELHQLSILTAFEEFINSFVCAHIAFTNCS